MLSNGHESLDYIIFIHIFQNVSLNERDKAIMRLSLILFLHLVLTKFILENTLSTLDVTIARSNTILRNK